MIDSSASPPLPVRPGRTVLVVVCSSSRDGILHHFQRRALSGPKLEGHRRLPNEHPEPVDHVRSTSPCLREQVRLAAGVDDVEHDLSRGNSIDQRRGDFTRARHAERRCIDDDSLGDHLGGRQI